MYRSRLSYSTVPWLAGAIPVSAPSRVDLPAPLGPITPMRQRSPSGKRDVVEQHPAARQRDGQVVGDVGDVAGVEELLQFLADQPERRRADADDVPLGHRRRADPLAVDERAVVAAEVVRSRSRRAGPCAARRGTWRRDRSATTTWLSAARPIFSSVVGSCSTALGCRSMLSAAGTGGGRSRRGPALAAWPRPPAPPRRAWAAW